MSSGQSNTAGIPFRDAGFRTPAVALARRSDGTLLLRSELALPPLPGCTTDWLRHWCGVRPDNPMLAERSSAGEWRSLSCLEVLTNVRSIASMLLRLGASSERPLVILSENSTEQALLTWGALYAGVPVAPVSPTYSLLGDFARLRAAVSLVAPFMVFVQDAGRFGSALRALDLAPGRILTVHNAAAGMMRLADWIGAAPDSGLDAYHGALSPDMPAKYMFTSGSTGIPKAVVQTRGMLTAAQEMTVQVLERIPQAPPVYLEWLPWHHVMGGNIALGRVLRFGGTLFIDDGRPVPGRFDATLRNLRDVAPSSYMNVPAGLEFLVAALEHDESFARHFFSNLTYVYYGGAALGRDIYHRFQAVAVRTTGERIVLTSAFGATETAGPGLTQYWGADAVGCIGLPLPGIDLKLIEDASLAGRYELRIRGPNVMRQYLKAPEQTERAFDHEGFYCLGDAVSFVNPDTPAEGLRFAGRCAEDFKLASGTWVRTAALRARLLDVFSPLLKDAIVTSDGRDTIGSLAWPDPEGCCRVLPELRHAPPAHLRDHPVLLAELARRLNLFNRGTYGSSMRVERLALLFEPPSIQTYEVTEKGTLNQRAVIEQRRKDVTKLFASPCQDGIVSCALTSN